MILRGRLPRNGIVLMNDDLTIDFKWMGDTGGGAFDRAFAAEIGLKLGDQWLTELAERESQTTMTHVRACAYTLARWLAGNWWRLRWEPETRSSPSDAEWRMAHSIANAGGGFAWPNIVFASDGESLAVASFRRLRAEAHEPLRYLNEIHGRITAGEFERRIDAYIQAVLTRRAAFKIDDDDLAQLWSEVLAERQDPEAADWRRLEALCGYDPDEAPEALIEVLCQDELKLGKRALEEVAAHGRHQTETVLSSIRDLASAKGSPGAGGFRCRPRELRSRPRYQTGMRPWERAAKLAKLARKEWDLKHGKVYDLDLGDILGIPRKAFKDGSDRAATPFHLALRNNGESSRLYFASSYGANRRFAACRLLGHWLDKGDNPERLIPATEAKTAEQQFQRAFAQEFLCPFEALKDHLAQDPPSSEDIEDAAAHFDVSPLLVRTLLVNKGEMDRESLNWAA